MASFDAKILELRPGPRDALSVSLDYEADPQQTYPVFLFTPDMNDTREHWHIKLGRQQAAALRDWLDDYLS